MRRSCAASGDQAITANLQAAFRRMDARRRRHILIDQLVYAPSHLFQR